jgi:hypothetical protein
MQSASTLLVRNPGKEKISPKATRTSNPAAFKIRENALPAGRRGVARRGPRTEAEERPRLLTAGHDGPSGPGGRGGGEAMAS